MLTSARRGANLPRPSRGRPWGVYLSGGPDILPVRRLAIHAPGTPTTLGYRASAAAWRVARVTDSVGRKQRSLAWSDEFSGAITLAAATVAALAAVVASRALGHNGIGLFIFVPAAWIAGAWVVERLMARRVASVTAAAKTRFITAVTSAERESLQDLSDTLDTAWRWNVGGLLPDEKWSEAHLYAWHLAGLPPRLLRDRSGEVASWLRSLLDDSVTAGAPSRWW